MTSFQKNSWYVYPLIYGSGYDWKNPVAGPLESYAACEDWCYDNGFPLANVCMGQDKEKAQTDNTCVFIGESK